MSADVNLSGEDDFSDGEDFDDDKKSGASMYSGEEGVSVDLGDQAQDMKS